VVASNFNMLVWFASRSVCDFTQRLLAGSQIAPPHSRDVMHCTQADPAPIALQCGAFDVHAVQEAPHCVSLAQTLQTPFRQAWFVAHLLSLGWYSH
jgi:hypothetical protein